MPKLSRIISDDWYDFPHKKYSPPSVMGGVSLGQEIDESFCVKDFEMIIDVHSAMNVVGVCWRRELGAIGDCTHGFHPTSGPLKNKFCETCRRQGLRISASRLRVVTSSAPKGLLKNSHGHGVWASAKTTDGGRVDYRIVNNNRKVSGAGLNPVIIFRGEPPPTSQLVTHDGPWSPGWLADVPDEWVEDGNVWLAVTHATLTPISSMKKHVRKRRYAPDDAKCFKPIQMQKIDTDNSDCLWADGVVHLLVAPAHPDTSPNHHKPVIAHVFNEPMWGGWTSLPPSPPEKYCPSPVEVIVRVLSTPVLAVTRGWEMTMVLFVILHFVGATMYSLYV